MIAITVKHGRQSYPLTFDPSKGATALKRSVSTQTKIPVDKLTVICKGGVKVDHDADVFKINSSSKVTVMGQVDAQWAKLMDIARRLRLFEADVNKIAPLVGTEAATPNKTLELGETLTKLLLEMDGIDLSACELEDDVLRGRRKELVNRILGLIKICEAD
ncbi:hypothetical protein SARC_05303 [Sphaeroforma arctica JP610]|uniref:BAG domain-containing protein n=1 Tax=Sphaeroforma arctica JP610 TaxID=667725 RepID=A0A0L0FZW7_9EUKA|nr:hypothetical protein SARC_05303 [Sphaeroforma arctica JP610]KNC82407.1 hypothetical protein SARC_05303 [Sphaeroforma arctica JP610]|eukprot:XP_014156309.1 hypothetical protein SARC_05303 [Sphaeroforma arctica JP610]